MAKKEKQVVKLTFPQKRIKEPVIFTMAKKFDVMPNIRRARITSKIGEVVLELVGTRKDLDRGIAYMEKAGVVVEPIVGDIVE